MAFSWATTATRQVETLAETITQVRLRIDEDTVDQVTVAQITSLIASGLRAIGREADLHYNYCTDTHTTGTIEYTLPTGMGEIYSVEILDSANRPTFIQPRNSSDTQCLVNNWHRVGDILYVGENILSGTLRVFGQQKPIVPTETTDYTDLDDEQLECLYAWVEFMYWKRRRMASEAQLAYTVYKDMLSDVIDASLRREGLVGLGYGTQSPNINF